MVEYTNEDIVAAIRGVVLHLKMRCQTSYEPNSQVDSDIRLLDKVTDDASYLTSQLTKQITPCS